jgi:hypothetical protein
MAYSKKTKAAVDVGMTVPSNSATINFQVKITEDLMKAMQNLSEQGYKQNHKTLWVAVAQAIKDGDGKNLAKPQLEAIKNLLVKSIEEVALKSNQELKQGPVQVAPTSGRKNAR